MSEFAKATETVPENDAAVHSWLVSQLTENRATLLAFDEDGLIWGRLAGKELVTAPHAPELRGKTLQQAFVFGPEDEVRLFRDELGTWKALLVKDAGEVILESQILWGDESAATLQDGFLHVRDLRKGVIDQFVPVDRPLGQDECVRLEVHHLVVYEETGEARIALSRLAGLSVGLRDLEVAK